MASTVSATTSRQSRPQRLNGSKNRAFSALFDLYNEPQTSVWGFLYALIYSKLGQNLKEFCKKLNFCILTPPFDTTSFFCIWFIVFLAVTLPKMGQHYGTDFGTLWMGHKKILSIEFLFLTFFLYICFERYRFW